MNVDEFTDRNHMLQREKKCEGSGFHTTHRIVPHTDCCRWHQPRLKPCPSTWGINSSEADVNPNFGHSVPDNDEECFVKTALVNVTGKIKNARRSPRNTFFHFFSISLVALRTGRHSFPPVSNAHTQMNLPDKQRHTDLASMLGVHVFHATLPVARKAGCNPNPG